MYVVKVVFVCLLALYPASDGAGLTNNKYII